MLKLNRIPQRGKANRPLKRKEEGGPDSEETVEVEAAFKRFWQQRTRRQPPPKDKVDGK